MSRRVQNDACTVFVANISYDVGVEQLKELFSRVGTVINVRIVTDKDTGRSRGFGFIEFTEESSVQSAIAQLKGMEINGRPIRVDRAGSGRNSKETHSLEEAVSKLSMAQVHDVVAQMKELAQKRPEQAREVLLAHPQLAQALLQAQIMLGMLKTPPPQAAAMGAAGGQMGGMVGGGGFPGMAGPGTAMAGGFQPWQLGTGAMGMPPVQAPPMDSELATKRQGLLEQVRQMTPQAIENLPLEQQQQVIMLRQSMGL
eukprot:g914.t1